MRLFASSSIFFKSVKASVVETFRFFETLTLGHRPNLLRMRILKKKALYSNLVLQVRLKDGDPSNESREIVVLF